MLLTAIQGYGIAAGLESWGGGTAVIDPGWFFRITTVITLIGGTMFLMWLGEQITSRGIGNGISLIIMAGIVSRLPVSRSGNCSSRPAPARCQRRLPGPHRVSSRSAPLPSSA